MPDYLWITELRAVYGDDGVAGVFGEGVAVVEGVGYLLRFFLGRVEGVDGHYAVCLVWEETAGVVDVYNRGAGEDAFSFGARVDRNRLVLPVVEVLRCCVTPMLVPSHDIRGIVYCGY